MNIEIIEACVEKLHNTFDCSDLDIEWTKIQKKMEEARYNPGDLKPLADCIFSLLLAARSRGYKADAVFEKLTRISENLIDKSWKHLPDGTYQAI